MSAGLRYLPTEERPRERMLKVGAEALATHELIAIVIGSGTRGKSVLHLAQELLGHFGGLEALQKASVEELCELHGMGRAKAVQLKAALTLGVRASQGREISAQPVHHPRQVYELVREYLEDQECEHVGVVLLGTKGQFLRYEGVSVGSLSEAIVHPREVFHPAVRHRAASVVVVHNHPSGDPTPSPEDYEVTRVLIRAGQTLQIPVQDHVIVGKGAYESLRRIGGLVWD